MVNSRVTVFLVEVVEKVDSATNGLTINERNNFVGLGAVLYDGSDLV